MIKHDELTAEDAIKERYDRPLPVRHGPLRDVTGQLSPVRDSPGDLPGDAPIDDGGGANFDSDSDGLDA
jgi:hypothetical protein